MPISWQKKRCFCNKKTEIAWLTMLKSFSHANEKKKQKTMFYQWSYSLWKSNLKYPNICFQFSWAQIFAAPFWKICSTRPQNFLEVWGEKVKRKHGYMWSFVYPLNSSYKYVKKVKLNPNSYPNIFSEIIKLQENGGSGVI